MRKIWAYGLIRKGQNMHHGSNLGEPIKTIRIKGLDMYTYGYYPRAVRGKGSIVVELYNVDDKTFVSMNRIEINSGYEPVKTNGAIIWIFKYPDNLIEHEATQIEHGDWVRWCKEN